MGSRAIMLLRANPQLFSFRSSGFPKAFQSKKRFYAAKYSLDPPDVPSLAEKARISLTPKQVEEFAPKIRQVVDWFGQLQAVDLQSIEPALRAETEGDNLRDDVPQVFDNRDAIIGTKLQIKKLVKIAVASCWLRIKIGFGVQTTEGGCELIRFYLMPSLDIKGATHLLYMIKKTLSV
ncbi:glutamyl-tRNA(Gln) amidotransferase subunit C, chloroplastic/mitochondrial-like isoform X1 [Salvia splendens]|uniref:glutamyl-tRNA(Gln) amidotransferase subunit C, chloroplastic/mitochondrial-like isoform X1 n=1 Tax=Salvia splendens TaxID=180675 RepID=UPI001C25A9FF|nr:glutamyl-tRNA(Gln) amidotransferase subunit C, chloroplastic/mitochondrial-like isoform X1 [Salvia splendens]